MSAESPNPHVERLEPAVRLMGLQEKDRLKDSVMNLLSQYPENFFTNVFEEYAESDYANKDIVLAEEDGNVIGCLFFDRNTHECDWLAVSKTYSGAKREVAKKLFQTVFEVFPKGSKVFWYINTEDAMYNGKPVGASFERGRNLYREMGATLTRVEDKFGPGNHAYLVEYTT